MRIARFKPPVGENYGDLLNNYLWPRLIPRINEPEGVFYGIGTLLDEKMPKDRPAIVFGTGAGYGPVPDLTGVDIRFVRGPRSAAVLGLKEEQWVTDPAIMIDGSKPVLPAFKVSFIPRWTQIAHDPTIPERLEAHGIHTIDPRWCVEQVTEEIASSALVVSEALHGCIVADTLRVPWISCYSDQGHLFKWLDWTESMELRYSPADLHVSPVRWIADNWEPQLSNVSTWAYKRRLIRHHIEKLNDDFASR